jgi:hypothetical protein
MANNALPPKVQLICTGRWCVKLDDAAKYPWFKDGIACFYPNELSPEGEKGDSDGAR